MEFFQNDLTTSNCKIPQCKKKGLSVFKHLLYFLLRFSCKKIPENVAHCSLYLHSESRITAMQFTFAKLCKYVNTSAKELSLQQCTGLTVHHRAFNYYYFK